MTSSWTTNHKGNVAELAIAAAATKLGIDVSKPLVEHTRYDLIFGVNGKLLRVQCKWARRRGDVVAIQIRGNYHSPTRGYVSSTYSGGEIDAIAAYCGDLNRCFYLPIDLVEGLTFAHLRLRPPRNAQRAGIRMAAHFELGAIAQLGERVAGSDEGVGSSPTGSTGSAARVDDLAVGSNEFRDHFGWYMQRASAGETFLVTRRGRPYVRLVPACDQPTSAPDATPDSA